MFQAISWEIIGVLFICCQCGSYPIQSLLVGGKCSGLVGWFLGWKTMDE